MQAKNKNRINKKAGFTLLEVMITLAIIGIMSGIGIVSLSSSRNLAKLRNAQQEVALTIKLAQSYALQGKRCGSNAPTSYGFSINSLSTYGLQCNGSNVESYTLSGGVTFPVSPGTISFDVPHANVTFSPGSMTDITFQSGGVSKTISINGRGVITIN